jgi:hypothetical protein
MFTGAPLTIATRCKCPRFYPQMSKWIHKIWYIDAMEYYLAFKRKEILSHATTWMNLEDITLNEIKQALMLSEINQIKVKPGVVVHTCNPSTRKAVTGG